MTATPEHVLWAIERDCLFRNSSNWPDPEQAARELKPLRAYSEAVNDGRVFDGICLDRLPFSPSSAPAVMGFSTAEIVNVFGDEALVDLTCTQCPANAPDGLLAGCYGCFSVIELIAPVNKAIERLKEVCGKQGITSLNRRPVRQGFYGVWMTSTWRGEMLSFAVHLFDTVVRDAERDDEQFLRFVTALHRAEQHNLAMRVRLMPQGRLEGKWWHIVEHCPHCRAPWVRRNRHCSVCDFVGNPSPARKRHSRGNRPFVPLERIVGEDNVTNFLKRFAQTIAVAERSTRKMSQPPPYKDS